MRVKRTEEPPLAYQLARGWKRAKDGTPIPMVELPQMHYCQSASGKMESYYVVREWPRYCECKAERRYVTDVEAAWIEHFEGAYIVDRNFAYIKPGGRLKKAAIILLECIHCMKNGKFQEFNSILDRTEKIK